MTYADTNTIINRAINHLKIVYITKSTVTGVCLDSKHNDCAKTIYRHFHTFDTKAALQNFLKITQQRFYTKVSSSTCAYNILRDHAHKKIHRHLLYKDIKHFNHIITIFMMWEQYKWQEHTSSGIRDFTSDIFRLYLVVGWMLFGLSRTGSSRPPQEMMITVPYHKMSDRNRMLKY